MYDKTTRDKQPVEAQNTGPRASDRFATALVVSDLESRTVKYDVVTGRTRITIARGKMHGIRVGMEGYIKAAGGMLADFQLHQVDRTACFAFVNLTPDQLGTHQFVVLRPKVMPKTRANGDVHPTSRHQPIQRRSAGVTSTEDVRATAEAGVAGARSRLPHFEPIQRAFGRHDISGIDAQVGGPALSASRSLGAEAYATGNKVAFSSAPDLHTAAHEAAHAIQQQRGAVGFQGLGDPDDAHEAHADAVADEVVAGRSAEPLLDKLTGGGGATAVQRKPTARAAAPTRMSATDHTRFVELLLQQVTQVAQQANRADQSSALLTGAMQTVSCTAVALDAARVPGPGIMATQLFLTLDGAYVAMAELHDNMRRHVELSSHTPVLASIMVALSEHFRTFGWRAPASITGRRTRARTAAMLGSDTLTDHEKVTLGLMHLRMARHHVLEGWKAVASGKVERVGLSVTQALKAAGTLLVDPNLDASASLEPELDATESVLERLFIYIETNHQEALPSLRKLAESADVLRRLVGRAPGWVERTQPVAPPNAVPNARSIPGRATKAEPHKHKTANDVVATDRVDRVAPPSTGDTYVVAGFEVDPLTALGGPLCQRDPSHEGCLLETAQRNYLLASYWKRVDDAQKEFHAALAELHVDTLLAKDKQPDISWVASLVLDVLSVFVIGKLANVLKLVRASGVGGLRSMVANGGVRDLIADRAWQSRAATMLENLSDKDLEKVVKAGVDPLKKATSKSLQKRGNAPDATSKGQNLSFLDQLRVQVNVGFGQLKEQVPGEANDLQLLTLNETFRRSDHQKGPYKAALTEKLARFQTSGVKRIGRRYEDANDARRVIRDVRVVWTTYASGRPMELVYEHHDGYRPAADHYAKPGPVPIGDELRDVMRDPSAPQALPRRSFGPKRPMTDEPVRGLSDNPQSMQVVPTEFVGVALAFHEQEWGTPPAVVFVDDRPARKPSPKAGA